MIHTIGWVQDITERKRAEEALRHSEERFKQLADVFPETIFEADLSGRLTYANAHGIQWFGEETALARHENILSFVIPEHRKMAQERIQERLQGKTGGFLELKALKKDGQTFDAMAYTAPILTDGLITGMRGFILDISERKRVEVELRESEERYRSLFENAPVGVFYSSSEGKIIEVNDEYALIMGYTSPDELREIVNQSTIAEAIYIQSDERARLVEKVITAPGKWMRSEEHFRKKDGTSITANLIIRAIPEIPETLEGFVEDITERKRSDEALRVSEERFRTLYENSTIGLYRTAPDGTILLANPTLVEKLGYLSFEELSERNLEHQGFEPSYERKHFIEEMEKFGEVKGLEAAWTRKDGSIIHVRESARAIRDSDRRVLYYDGSVEDITERKHAEETLRESEERYRSIIKASPDDITIADLEGRILMVSPAAVTMFGFDSEEQPLGLPITDFIVPEDRERAVTNLSIRIRGGQPSSSIYHGLKRNGNVFDIEVNTDFIRDIHGQPTKFVIIVRDITERKKTEQALRESEQRFHRLFSASPDALMLLDPSSDPDNWLIVDCNERACQMNGYTRDELVGRQIDILHAPDAVADDCAAYLARIRKEGVVHFETTHRHRDGHIFQIETSTSIITLEGHELIMGVDHDITEKKRIEKALQETQLRYRAAVEQSNDGIGIADLEGRYIMVNHALCAMTGYTEEEMLKMHVSELVPKPAATKLFNEVVNMGDLYSREAELLRKDGTTFIAFITGSLIEVGDTRYVQGIVRDITERKRAERHISDSLEYSQTILDASPIGIVTFKESGEVVSANKAAAAILGGTIEQLLTQNFRTLKSMEQSGLQAAAISALSSGDNEDVEVRHISTFGKELWLTARFVPISHQAQMQLLLLISDITEAKRSEEALRHAQKLESIGTLAGGIAHDFNNLLNAMLGQSALALGKLPNESRAKYHIEKSIQAADRAADLTRQLLAYSGKGKLVTQEIDLNRLVEENVQLLKVSVSKTTQLRYKIGSSPLCIHGDVGQIQQVIMNLIINASEAMGSNPGSITISTNHIDLTDDTANYLRYTNDPLPPG